MVSLETLDLRRNLLTALPEGVGGMVSLKTLILIGNQLTSLPEGITALTGLQQLMLQDNPLVRPQTPTVEAWLAALAASGCTIHR
jgi:Leucine-rich repeat (LRR) protein